MSVVPSLSASPAPAAQLPPTLPTHVVKRDGARAPFDLAKIAVAIARAGAATGEYDAAEAQRLAASVGRVLAHRFDAGVPGIESIQDTVEHTLAAAGYFDTARAYIVYRDRHARLRDQRKTLVDVAASIDEYLDQKDWRVNANANQGYSLGGLILNVSGKVVANYWLSHVYAPEIGRAHRDGDVHIHDLDMLAGYCAGWSLRQLLHEGLNGVPGKVESGPAQAHVERGRADRQLPRHAAERMGRRAGVQLVRHLHGAVRPQGRHDLRRGEAVHPGADLQPQRAVALGHADAVHQPDVRLDLPGRPQGADPGHRRRGDAVRVRRPAAARWTSSTAPTSR